MRRRWKIHKRTAAFWFRLGLHTNIALNYMRQGLFSKPKKKLLEEWKFFSYRIYTCLLLESSRGKIFCHCALLNLFSKLFCCICLLSVFLIFMFWEYVSKHSTLQVIIFLLPDACNLSADTIHTPILWLVYLLSCNINCCFSPLRDDPVVPNWFFSS